MPSPDQAHAGSATLLGPDAGADLHFEALVRLQPEDRLRPDQRREGVVCLPLDYDSENLQHIAHLKGLPR